LHTTWDCFNTFTFWEGLRLFSLALMRLITNGPFQHLYLLGRSATLLFGSNAPDYQRAVSTPLPSGKVCDHRDTPLCGCRACSFNTFTFWEGLRRWLATYAELMEAKFQHLYLLGRSATLIMIRSPLGVT